MKAMIIYFTIIKNHVNHTDCYMISISLFFYMLTYSLLLEFVQTSDNFFHSKWHFHLVITNFGVYSLTNTFLFQMIQIFCFKCIFNVMSWIFKSGIYLSFFCSKWIICWANATWYGIPVSYSTSFSFPFFFYDIIIWIILSFVNPILSLIFWPKPNYISAIKW